MPQISTLIKDIHELVGKDDRAQGGAEGWFDSAIAKEFSGELGLRLVADLAPRNKVPTLRLSQMGPKCQKQLWHSIHTPELSEPLPPSARIKFSYGHIIEALVIAMAKAAGHEVLGEQDELYVDGVTGHRDCVIDGCIVDVKSSSTLSFKKFKDKTIAENDSFGYLDQLDGYLVGSANDDLVRTKDTAYLLAVDKQLGHLTLYEHTLREASIRARIRDYKAIVALSRPPSCTCEQVPDGLSGNIKLGTRASYSSFKHCCFPHLRTFLYSGGPRYLTKVVRLPKDVPEIDKNGKLVYNAGAVHVRQLHEEEEYVF